MNGSEEQYVAERSEQLRRASGLTRRELVGFAAAGTLAAGLGGLVRPGRAGAAIAATSPIVKPLPSEWFNILGTNAEMRWDSVGDLGYTTPNERFFVRNHTATPMIDATAWRLDVFGSGLDGDGASFTYEQLRRLPSRELTAFIECAGNGRSLFASQQGSPASGSQWALGAIGVARWRGVLLSEVLERAGLSNRAVDVMPSGLDATVVSGGVDQGHVRRPLPIAKALDDALLAYDMNGAPLPSDHGFPLRLVVPGWIGIANIKWIGDIEVSDRPLFSLWNTQQYKLFGQAYPDEPVLRSQTVKSAWELGRGAVLPAETRQKLDGRAWSGTSGIARVDVSIDRGSTWTEAKVHGRNGPGTWAQFTYTLPPQPAGSYELWARATDTAGRSQPTSTPFNTLGYLFDAVVRHPVVLS